MHASPRLHWQAYPRHNCCILQLSTQVIKSAQVVKVVKLIAFTRPLRKASACHLDLNRFYLSSRGPSALRGTINHSCHGVLLCTWLVGLARYSKESHNVSETIQGRHCDMYATPKQHLYVLKSIASSLHSSMVHRDVCEGHA